MSQPYEMNNKSTLEQRKSLRAVSREAIKYTILVVDDEEHNLQLVKRTLRRKYNILTATNGFEALSVIEKHGNELAVIISDQRMPQMTGTEFFSQIVDQYPNIIKMLLTGYSDLEAMIDGVNKCQLFQYISKPFDPDELLLIVKNGIEAYELSINKQSLLHDLRELFFTTIKSISSALDAKDTYTHGHSYRVTLFSLILAQQLNLSEKMQEDIEIAGLLHDIGKIGVPENILCKPGKLTDDEYDKIKTHPAQSQKILNGIDKLKHVTFWLSSHHERWDGKGYPLAIKGKEIPLPARMLAIADTYDAMTSNRSYRKGLPHEIAVEEIKRCAGSQFDPDIVEVYLQVEHIFAAALADPVEYYNKYSILNKYITAKD